MGKAILQGWGQAPHFLLLWILPPRLDRARERSQLSTGLHASSCPRSAPCWSSSSVAVGCPQTLVGAEPRSLKLPLAAHLSPRLILFSPQRGPVPSHDLNVQVPLSFSSCMCIALAVTVRVAMALRADLQMGAGLWSQGKLLGHQTGPPFCAGTSER